MSEEKNTTQAPAGPPVKRTRNDIYPFAVVAAIVVLLVLVVMGFLSSQKLHKQVVVLERQIEALQESGKKAEGQLQVLADELAVRALRQRRNRVRKAMRALDDLKPVVQEGSDLAGQVKSLLAGLQLEDERLGREVGRTHPRVTVSGLARPAAPGAVSTGNLQPAPRHLECANGVCRLVPETGNRKDRDYTIKVAVSPNPAPEKSSAAGHVAVPPSSPAPKAETWWTRFINLRLFGGN